MGKKKHTHPGSVEMNAANIVRRAKIQDVVIKTLYGTAALALAVMAPNAARLLRYIDPDLSKKRKPDYRIRQALKRLEERGLITRSGQGSVARFALTKKGQRYAQRLHVMESLVAPKPQTWDGRWRIVIFDIWERRRVTRARLRRMLAKIGFAELQHSVWVYPYDCEELLMFIRTELKLGPSVLYIVAEGIENDARLRRRFSLSRN